MLRIPLAALVLCTFLAGLAAAPRARADALADVTKYSVFTHVDLPSLAGGKVLAARGPALPFSRDLTVQALYLVHAPVARTLALHQQWDATKHSELKVYLHRDFSTHPAPGDFAAQVPGNGPVSGLAGATEKLPNLGDLQLSKAEAATFKGAGGGGAFPPGVRDFWSQLLFNRASAFLQRGLDGEPPYDSSDGAVRVAEEANRLIKEQPKVLALFRPLIEKSPLAGGAGSLPLAPYWEMFDAEGVAAFSLGAACSSSSADATQYLDLEYYASGDYYAYVTLYQMWPVTAGGKPATLVWRVDSISTLSIADLGQFDRMGSSAAMAKEIQRIVNFFLKDTGE